MAKDTGRNRSEMDYFEFKKLHDMKKPQPAPAKPVRPTTIAPKPLTPKDAAATRVPEMITPAADSADDVVQTENEALSSGAKNLIDTIVGTDNAAPATDVPEADNVSPKAAPVIQPIDLDEDDTAAEPAAADNDEQGDANNPFASLLRFKDKMVKKLDARHKSKDDAADESPEPDPNGDVIYERDTKKTSLLGTVKSLFTRRKADEEPADEDSKATEEDPLAFDLDMEDTDGPDASADSDAIFRRPETAKADVPAPAADAIDRMAADTPVAEKPAVEEPVSRTKPLNLLDAEDEDEDPDEPVESTSSARRGKNPLSSFMGIFAKRSHRKNDDDLDDDDESDDGNDTRKTTPNEEVITVNEDAKNIKENSLTELLADSVDEPYTPRSARKEINAEPDEIDETLAHSAAHPQPVEVEPATPALDETRIYPAVAEKADVLDSESEPTQEFSPVRAQAEKFDAAAFGDGETDEDDEDDDADETTKKHGFSLFGKRKKQHADADIDEDEIASAEDADEDAEEEPSDIDSRHFDYDDYDEEENDDNEDDDEDYDEGMTFGQNVLAFLKGLTMIALVLSIVVLGVNLLGEQGIISTAWLRSNLGGVGTTLFPETTVNNVAVQPEATIMPEETAEVPAVVITDAPVPTIAPAAVDTQAPVTATEAPTSTEEAPIAVN